MEHVVGHVVKTNVELIGGQKDGADVELVSVPGDQAEDDGLVTHCEVEDRKEA